MISINFWPLIETLCSEVVLLFFYIILLHASLMLHMSLSYRKDNAFDPLMKQKFIWFLFSLNFKSKEIPKQSGEVLISKVLILCIMFHPFQVAKSLQTTTTSFK